MREHSLMIFSIELLIKKITIFPSHQTKKMKNERKKKKKKMKNEFYLKKINENEFFLK